MWQVNYHVQLMKSFSPLFLRRSRKKALSYLKGAKFFNNYWKQNRQVLHITLHLMECPFSHWKDLCARKVKHIIFNYIFSCFLLWQPYHYLGSYINSFTSLNKKFLPWIINKYLFFHKLHYYKKSILLLPSDTAQACLFARFRIASFFC